jgi:hypothetical protein
VRRILREQNNKGGERERGTEDMSNMSDMSDVLDVLDVLDALIKFFY